MSADLTLVFSLSETGITCVMALDLGALLHVLVISVLVRLTRAVWSFALTSVSVTFCTISNRTSTGQAHF